MIMPFRHKIEGGALFLAIFVILILSILSAGFILLNRLWFHENTIFTKMTQLNDHLDAAEIIIREEPDLTVYGETRTIDIFEDSTEINLHTEQWGLLRLVKLSTSWRNLKLDRAVLYAGADNKHCSLYLTDNNKFLSLVGKCFLNGDCYIPASGIRAGEIDGETFLGNKFIEGTIYKSNKKLPSLNKDLIEPFSDYWDNKYRTNDSVININDFIRNPKSSVSFNTCTTVINCGNNIYLQDVSLSGNIILIASDTIRIAPSAKLEDIVLFAKTIIVSANVRGTFQLFAKEKIVVSDNCMLDYPSFAVCFSNYVPAQIIIGKNSSILGGLIIDSHSENSDKNSLIMSEGVWLTGLVYVNGKVGFAGHIEGSLYCNSFFINTARAYYENFLKDAVIDPQTVPAQFGSFVIDNTPQKLKVVKQCL
jgi:hypothetical protein